MVLRLPLDAALFYIHVDLMWPCRRTGFQNGEQLKIGVKAALEIALVDVGRFAVISRHVIDAGYEVFIQPDHSMFTLGSKSVFVADLEFSLYLLVRHSENLLGYTSVHLVLMGP